MIKEDIEQEIKKSEEDKLGREDPQFEAEIMFVLRMAASKLLCLNKSCDIMQAEYMRLPSASKRFIVDKRSRKVIL